MLKPLSKPRWASWEDLCLKAAFKKKIQLKIIATALQKTVTSVSKKIRALGLRQENTKPGRLKGDEYNGNWSERTSLDFENMMMILRTYAPLSSSSSKHLPVFPPEKSIKREYRVVQKNSPYSFAPSLAYAVLEEKSISLPGISKGYDNSVSIPLCYLEQWALLKGFQEASPELKEQGLLYWRQGRYFSKAQVLVCLNGIRLLKKLKPVFLDEEEKGNQLKTR
jgi:hypothetical protein